ncbi:YojF family protein [Ferviditalea candida]|uniref:YojF family protein n=1 Tax=Ferviditalea candida TaxID=3108399 RepID=A0ABU5ZJ76_9BACL|nr:YojF family protein [Paenibacillaceae bacterium T2]
MRPIDLEALQHALDQYAEQDVYLHLETTNGAYASHLDATKITAGAYIRNGLIRYTRGSVKGQGPYRIGLKLPLGWVYAEGLTHWETDSEGRLLTAGHDGDGKLAVALELSRTPFPT